MADAKKSLMIELLADDSDAKAKLQNLQTMAATIQSGSGAAPDSSGSASAIKEEAQAARTAVKDLQEQAEKSVEVKVSAKKAKTEAKEAAKAVSDTENATKKSPGGLLSKISAGFQKIRKDGEEMKQGLEGSQIGSMLSPMALAAGIAAVAVKSLSMVWDSYLAKLQKGADTAKENADQLTKLAQINDAKRESDMQSMNQLQALASVESMSNAQKSEAAKLVKSLSGAYGDLGVSIDETTGKIIGADTAMTKMLSKQHDKKMREQQGILKQLEAEYGELSGVIEDAGIHIFDWFQIGGEEATLNAAQRQKEVFEQIRDVKLKLNALEKEDPDKKRQLAADMELSSAKELLTIQKLKTAGDSEGAAKLEFMISLRSKNLDLTAAEKDRLFEINRELAKEQEKQAALAAAKAKAAADEEAIKQKAKARQEAYDAILSQAEYELQMSKLRQQGLTEEAAKLELITSLKRQGFEYSDAEIDVLLKKNQAVKESAEAEAKAEKIRQQGIDSRQYAEDELDNLADEIALQKLKNAGLDEEAERLKLMQDLKKQNLTLTDEEVEKILAGRKQLKELQQTSGESGRPDAINSSKNSDSLTKIGLYNFGNSTNTMDKERNDLIRDIKTKLDKFSDGGELS